MEQKEMLTTPIKIEFNLPSTVAHFNVMEEVEALFVQMTNEDYSLRIWDTQKTVVLWETKELIVDDERFNETFQLREQRFRKGNKKMTLFCVVESMLSINRIKYSNPMKEYIFDKNIWIKPDYYSTQIVSCPGFLSLVHPKWTNKQEWVKDITKAIERIEIDVTEKVVQEWFEKNESDISKRPVKVPTFHIESTVRKWGKLHTEVLSILCSTDDANYLKYLMAEVGEKNLLPHGLFIPTGMHLMEGKGVLMDILLEHQKFLDAVTSIQIGGIAVGDMHNTSDDQESIKKVLLQAEGVISIEKLYHTENSGQWAIVIQRDCIDTFVKYIETNLLRIYKNRSTTTPKLITYKANTGEVTNRLVLTEKTVGRIGSYAEVLPYFRCGWMNWMIIK